MNANHTARYIANLCSDACAQAAEQRAAVVAVLTSALTSSKTSTSLPRNVNGSALEHMIADDALAALFMEIRVALSCAPGDAPALDPLKGAPDEAVITATRDVRARTAARLTGRTPQQLTGLDAVYDYYAHLAAVKFLSITDAVDAIDPAPSAS